MCIITWTMYNLNVAQIEKASKQQGVKYLNRCALLRSAVSPCSLHQLQKALEHHAFADGRSLAELALCARVHRGEQLLGTQWRALYVLKCDCACRSG